MQRSVSTAIDVSSTCHTLGRLAGCGAGWLAGWGRERPREAQRGGAWIELAFHVLGWRLPQADLRPGRLPTDIFMCGHREEAPTDYHDVQRVPNRNPLQTQGLPTRRITTREAPHKQNYIRPGRLPTSIITTREPTHKQNCDQGAGWLAGWRNYIRPGCLSCAWLAG